jgi:peptide subunit release factor 1 (eRF1)
VPGKQATGGWFALSQTRYARHTEDHVRRHVEHVMRGLGEMFRQRPFDRIILAGPEEALAVVRQHLPRPLRARLAGMVSLEMFASDAAVLNAVLPVAEALEQQAELEAVDGLFEAIGSPRVAADIRSTLEALTDGRVHKLFVSQGMAMIAGECSACGRLAEYSATCPVCGGAVNPVDDLAERAVARAREQGASVELVSGQAAARLQTHGGLAAWTRY